MRHVFGDHTTQKFGTWEVDWIEPQRVQDRTEVRVLVAKDAISTGWDCPRAEVMVSFRPATDHVHITQLLGRMVRSPLARRVPGDEKLNSVECILPFFDRTTAGSVVKFLTGQISEVAPPTKKAIIEECPPGHPGRCLQPTRYLLRPEKLAGLRSRGRRRPNRRVPVFDRGPISWPERRS